MYHVFFRHHTEIMTNMTSSTLTKIHVYVQYYSPLINQFSHCLQEYTRLYFSVIPENVIRNGNRRWVLNGKIVKFYGRLIKTQWVHLQAVRKNFAKLLECMRAESRALGLEMNICKSKSMLVDFGSQLQFIGRLVYLQLVHKFPYLGSPWVILESLNSK